MSIEENNIEQTNSEENPKRRRTQRRRPRKSVEKKPKTTEVQSGEWSLDQFVVAEEEGKVRFHDFYLPDSLMRGIHELGFEYATPIQAATIKPALQGLDIIGKAQTGTGKTAAFLIGLITDLLDFKLDVQPRFAEPRALIIAPTRELALQIAADAEGLCKYTGLKIVSLVGGMDYDVQRAALAEAPVDILVATPGRLIDFVRSQDIDLYNVEVLVLDEADRMLSMGFIPDVRTIIRSTPRKGAERQTLLYSATFTDEIMRLAAQWTRDPVTIEIESEHKTTDNVSQEVYLVSSSEKYNLLRNYLKVNGIDKAIVFCNRRHQTRALAERLSRDGVKAAMMSGEIPQQKRIKTLEGFRNGSIEVLVATDVAGRGIHIDGVSHVVNYQLPEDADDYVHRIGRTGRAGATGTSICFACEDDSFLIPEIEAQTGVKLECIHPDPELLKSPEVAEKPAAAAPVDEIASDEVSDEETAGEASCCVAESEVASDETAVEDATTEEAPAELAEVEEVAVDEPVVEEAVVEESGPAETEEVEAVALAEEPTTAEESTGSEETAESSEEENSTKS